MTRAARQLPAALGAISDRLIGALYPQLRLAMAVLWLAGAAIAGFSCLRAAGRVGWVSAATFAVVAIALIVLAVGTLRAAGWALGASVVLSAAQLIGAVGAAVELLHDGETAKTRQLRALGVDPTVGIAANLAYSTTAAGLFVWALARARRGRHTSG